MRILFFGRLADGFGRIVEVDAGEGQTVGDLRRRLALTDPGVRACIGDLFVGDEVFLRHTGEVEFWPPVSGG